MEIIYILLLDWFGGAILSLPFAIILMFILDKKRFVRKWGWIILFVLYINAMFIIVGMPDIHHILWDPTINLITFNDFSVSNIRGMVLNIVMFIPFGGFVPVYFQYFRKVQRTVLSGFLLSLSIEVLQLFTFRTSDIDDLIMNTIGTLAGYGIARIIIHKSRNTEKEDKDRMKLILLLLFNGLMVVFVRYFIVELLYKVLGV